MLRFICTTMLCFLFSALFCQNLKISNGKKEKSFSKSSLFYFLVSVGENYEECCNLLEVTGNIKAIRGDSIEMNLRELSVQRSVQEISFDEYIESHSSSLYYTFHKDSVQSLSVYKDYKSYRRKSTIPAIGGIFIVTGLLTAANAWIVPDRSSKDRLRIVGGIQVGIGGLLALIWKDNSYNFVLPRKSWKIVN